MYGPDGLHQLLKESDWVVLAAPLTAAGESGSSAKAYSQAATPRSATTASP